MSDDYTPSSNEIDEALICRKAMKALLRHGDTTRLDPAFQKSLSSFSFGIGLSQSVRRYSNCDTSVATQPGQFSWMDLLQLKMEIPPQWMEGSVYLVNSRTVALLFTMSDAAARPLFSVLPERAPAFTFAGSPIIICTWMPDVAPGATPV